MIDGQFTNLILLSVGLGLLGFIEPCSVGSNLLFIKYIEGRDRVAKVSQAVIFMLTRGLFIGAMGAGAALFGTLFIELQKGGWLILGIA